ncbi:MAG TPA: type I-U CRISPR-associated RAMP protein Csb1/Cas7u [Longimicrobiaceae bacterium]|nr:type I-U CRISPR-associated RAMP protein Csb1/Cas7u [Longimicrobiaceae bacterium]
MTLRIPDAPRLLLEAELTPVQGTRFQPTGFPDLGAAAYRLHDGTQMLLVESPQSVANRLEATVWDPGAGRLQPILEGLSYVSVVDEEGAELTNSLLEAHRLNSVYIEKSDGFDKIRQAVGHEPGTPFDYRKLAEAVCRYDVNSLLHGVFLESIAGVLRIPRALSGFIEARDVSVVTSGGVKNDRVQAATGKDSVATAREGYGNVPFHRDEYTAGRITAYFNLDLVQLRSYALGEAVERLLFSLALWKIRTFLERGLRLRTACDLDVVDLRVTRPEGVEISSRGEIEKSLPELISRVREAGLFADPPVTRVLNGTRRKGGGKAPARRERAEAQEALS